MSEMKYTDYTILTTDTVGELAAEVRELMEEGWVPLGGVSVAAAMNEWEVVEICVQAMVKGESDGERQD